MREVLDIYKLDLKKENIISFKIGGEKESEYAFLKHYVSYKIDTLSKFLFWEKKKKVRKDIYNVITRYNEDKVNGITNYDEEIRYCPYAENLLNGESVILYNSDTKVKLGKDKIFLTGWDGHVYEGWKLIYVPFIEFNSKDKGGIVNTYIYHFNTNENLKDFINYLVDCGALSKTSAYIDERIGSMISDTCIEDYIKNNI